MRKNKNFRKSFMNKNAVLRIQYNSETRATFLTVGKKAETKWEWETANHKRKVQR